MLFLDQLNDKTRSALLDSVMDYDPVNIVPRGSTRKLLYDYHWSLGLLGYCIRLQTDWG